MVPSGLHGDQHLASACSRSVPDAFEPRRCYRWFTSGAPLAAESLFVKTSINLVLILLNETLLEVSRPQGRSFASPQPAAEDPAGLRAEASRGCWAREPPVVMLYSARAIARPADPSSSTAPKAEGTGGVGSATQKPTTHPAPRPGVVG